MSIILYDHQEGMGCIEFEDSALDFSIDTSSVAIWVEIDSNGLRDLANRLGSLADVIDGGEK